MERDAEDLGFVEDVGLEKLVGFDVEKALNLEVVYEVFFERSGYRHEHGRDHGAARDVGAATNPLARGQVLGQVLLLGSEDGCIAKIKRGAIPPWRRGVFPRHLARARPRVDFELGSSKSVRRFV